DVRHHGHVVEHPWQSGDVLELLQSGRLHGLDGSPEVNVGTLPAKLRARHGFAALYQGVGYAACPCILSCWPEVEILHWRERPRRSLGGSSGPVPSTASRMVSFTSRCWRTCGAATSICFRPCVRPRSTLFSSCCCSPMLPIAQELRGSPLS